MMKKLKNLIGLQKNKVKITCSFSLKQVIIKEVERYTLKGNCPILVATSLFSTLNQPLRELEKIIEKDKQVENNADFSSQTDSLAMFLNKAIGAHNIIDYYEPSHIRKENKDMLSIHKYYYDKDFKEYIIQNKIDLFVHLQVLDTLTPTDFVSIVETTSSFSYLEVTEITKKLAKLLESNNIPNHVGASRQQPLLKQGYCYTNAVIEKYKDIINLGELKQEPIPREKVWPRTLDIMISPAMNDEVFFSFTDVIIHYLSWLKYEFNKKESSPDFPKQKRKRSFKSLFPIKK